MVPHLAHASLRREFPTEGLNDRSGLSRVDAMNVRVSARSIVVNENTSLDGNGEGGVDVLRRIVRIH